MPELPEVETVRLGLQKGILGKAIQKVTLNRADLRFPFPKNFAKHLAGCTVTSIDRRAKYLLIHLAPPLRGSRQDKSEDRRRAVGGKKNSPHDSASDVVLASAARPREGSEVLIAHLGMSGRFSVLKSPPKKLGKHDHVVIIFADGTALVFNDPRRFGMMDMVTAKKLSAHKLLKHLGPEPLEKTFSPAYLKEALRKRKTSIKQALMDQEVVVGVGNIYASEALFLSGINPATAAHKTAVKSKEMVSAIQHVLHAALKSGGSSLNDFFDVAGNAGYFQHNFKVYDREGEPCTRCKTTIKRVVQGGRSTFFCARCQG